MQEDVAAIVGKALGIISRQVTISPFFQVVGAGDTGPVMEAARLLMKASTLEPHNASLHYAYVGVLQLAMQFKTAEEENAKLIELRPDYALAKFSREAWKAGARLSPSPFAYPEWTTTSKTLPRFYTDKLHTFTVFPAREGIYTRPVLFEKDSEGWWTKERLQNVKIEIAVVLDTGGPNIGTLYRKCSGPGLTKPDMQEALVVLDLPKDDLSLVGWEYLVDADFTDVVVVDRTDNVLLNQRVPIPEKTKTTFGLIRDILLNTRGRKVSIQEAQRAFQRYQSGTDLETIGNKYF